MPLPRVWRKWYSSAITSEQIARLTDGAAWLLALLVAAQDDSGYWPWTSAKVRSLIAARPLWTVELTTGLAKELVSVGIARWQDGGIVLLNGEKLNGRLRHDRAEEIYPRPNVDIPLLPDIPAVNQRLSTDIPEATPEKSESRVRVEEEEEKAASPASSLALPAPIIPPAKSQTLAEYLVVLRGRYPLLDCDAEWEGCCLWWEEHKNKMPSKSALLNWFKLAEARRRASPPVNGTQVRYNKGKLGPDGRDDPDKYWKGRYGHLAKS